MDSDDIFPFLVESRDLALLAISLECNGHLKKTGEPGPPRLLGCYQDHLALEILHVLNDFRNETYWRKSICLHIFPCN